MLKKTTYSFIRSIYVHIGLITFLVQFIFRQQHINLTNLPTRMKDPLKPVTGLGLK